MFDKVAFKNFVTIKVYWVFLVTDRTNFEKLARVQLKTVINKESSALEAQHAVIKNVSKILLFNNEASFTLRLLNGTI